MTGIQDKIKAVLLSGVISDLWEGLEEKHISLIMDIKNAEFLVHKESQFSNCAEIAPVGQKVILAGEDQNPLNQETQDSNEEKD